MINQGWGAGWVLTAFSPAGDAKRNLGTVSCGYVHAYPLPEDVVGTLVPLEAGLLVESWQGCWR